MVGTLETRGTTNLPPIKFCCRACRYEVMLSRRDGKDKFYISMLKGKRGDFLLLECPRCNVVSRVEDGRR